MVAERYLLTKTRIINLKTESVLELYPGLLTMRQVTKGFQHDSEKFITRAIKKGLIEPSYKTSSGSYLFTVADTREAGIRPHFDLGLALSESNQNSRE